MSLRALRTLQAIARYGSFARAGEVIGLTQSAVSLQIKALETELNTVLFDRSRRLPTLTEAGKIVLEKSEEILTLYDRIPAALSHERSLSGRLRVGAIQTVLFGVLPDALGGMSKDHPGLRVHVTAGVSADLSLRVAAGDLDAAVTTEPVGPHPPDLTWTPLYEDGLWVIAPEGHEGRGLRDLVKALPFIRFDPRAWAGRLIDNELRKMKIAVREEMVLDSPDIVLRMVEKGLGVAVVPLGDTQAAQLSMPCLPFGEPQVRRRVVLMERKDRRSAHLTAELINAIRFEWHRKLADGLA